MADCKNMNCPLRSNLTSNPYHCDIATCQRRDDGTVLIASNHTLTKDELRAWNDGKKDRIYCLGWVDPMTDAPLPECVACPDFVDKAQDDLEAFYGRA